MATVDNTRMVLVAVCVLGGTYALAVVGHGLWVGHLTPSPSSAGAPVAPSMAEPVASASVEPTTAPSAEEGAHGRRIITLVASRECGILALRRGGSLEQSMDQGGSWTQSRGTRLPATSHATLDGTDLYIATEQGAIVRISACGQGSESVLRAKSGDGEVNGIAASGPRLYASYVNKTRGRVVCSEDHGATLRVCDEQAAVPYYGVFLYDAGVYVCGGWRGADGGVVRRSTDGGRTWSTVARGLGAIVYDVWGNATGRELVAVGRGSELWGSADGGKSFRVLGTPGFGRGGSMALAHDQAPYFPNDFATWLAGDPASGTFLTINGFDARGDLASMAVEPTTVGPVDGALALGGARWLAFGWRGLRRSADDAKTWQP